MGLTDKIGIAILCAFVLFSVVRLFAAPLKLAAKVLLNTALGFLALFLLGLTEPVTGFSLGLNFFNALTVGILGVPGLVPGWFRPGSNSCCTPYRPSSAASCLGVLEGNVKNLNGYVVP